MVSIYKNVEIWIEIQIEIYLKLDKKNFISNLKIHIKKYFKISADLKIEITIILKNIYMFHAYICIVYIYR